ncbi:polysaccharide lyase family 7 protein [Ectopseudomonas mendocina]|uniref:Polysaccharide lyase family 7 protein n=1 Tax=Ectopseudomonas mendocina TaxID=300 RepID=A0ABD7RSX2_ECTME|nr:polysaccharide lyase family 7 protein [Pseudomonas mendocina]MDF2076236.1 polysaccharide lyase family 7 protein [Pseudomonas mendocina]TRO13023.1 polysaccharide lyase family 7 protein [Pseudomonas mendocina]TRO15570.1 polysaccharide lyase family 7 protein [Pseudomonas mendocina]
MIELAMWNLSIPVGVPATTIETRVLAGGYQDHYFQSRDGAIFFWSPVNGTTTESATYPRSELRETYADGSLRNWTYPGADHVLSARLSVSQVPSTGKIVIGQIHAHKSSMPLLKLEYQYKTKTANGNIVAKIRMTPDAEIQTVTVASGIALDQAFSYVINLKHDGTLAIQLDRNNWSTRLDSSWATKALYFKAGVYTQDNTGYETEAGAARFDQLNIEHRALLSAAP